GEEETAGASAEGVDNRKLGVWAFIGSESVFFASLISTYLIYKGRNVSGPVAETMLEIPLTSFSTFFLLTSSLLMVLALSAIQRGSERASRWWLLGTAALGLVFLGGQGYEFTHLSRGACPPDEPLRPDVLHAGRLPRGSRRDRCDLAAHPGGGVVRGPAAGA